MGSGRHQFASGPSRMATGGALSSAGLGELGLHPLAEAHSAWRRSHAAGMAVPMIRAELPRLLNGYVRARELMEDLDHYVIPPGLGNRAGILGALALAEEAYRLDQNRGSETGVSA